MLERNRADVGVIVIGRNEGERLRCCLASVLRDGARVVYVDSGSSDGSSELARTMGAAVVDLDMRIPFTAARARNAGFAFLLEQWPEVGLVQFVDGDCELCAGWQDEASRFLQENPGYAVVSGRLHERFPSASVYNRLCDIEWDAEPGDAAACGGIAMMRVDAFVGASGFNESLIAGEEPELCLRLRRQGWRIRRIASSMGYHDAAIMRFSQWWRRTTRGGYAFAEGAWMHGREPERHWVRETGRALFWGLAIPLLVVALGGLVTPWAWLLLLIYPFQLMRLSARLSDFPRAFFLVLGKFPEALGVLRFFKAKLFQRTHELIEYK